MEFFKIIYLQGFSYIIIYQHDIFHVISPIYGGS